MANKLCQRCFHSYVCEQFNEHLNSTVEYTRCHFYNDHFVDAADVEPVKHGRWYDIVEFNNGERIIATCSNCKDRGELRTDRNEWGIWHINSPRCPNCGAKMEEN